MTFKNQSDPLRLLEKFAQSQRHSVLIEGPEGCGKTYLAKQYSDMLKIADCIIIPSTVSAIRETIHQCYRSLNSVVVCVENLDTGSAGASNALLKFLEEPLDHVYIVVTCRNVYRIPDTIVSRSVNISVNGIHPEDIYNYCRHVDPEKCDLLQSHGLMCFDSISVADYLLQLDVDQLLYYTSIPQLLKSRNPVSTMVWQLGHFADNRELNVPFMLKYLSTKLPSSSRRHIIQCMDTISTNRIAAHVALTKLVFELKYGE